uniref:Uncharacterized protein n=1 Tax=Panagrolaimus superbus TaxID=310955 RepID=A0A914YS98_9BILA
MRSPLTFISIILLSYLLGCNGERRSRRNTKDGCESLNEISGEKIKFPRKFHNDFTRPWLRKDLNAKIYESKALTYNWLWMKELKIRGLNATVEDFLNVLEKYGCLFIPYGEAVKNILLGTIQTISPLKIVGESTCEISKVYQICERVYGPLRCGAKPTAPWHRVTFGNIDDNERFKTPMVDPVIVSTWNLTFNRPKVQWEFSANAVGLYDNTAGGVYLIDMTGLSVKDICRRIIVIPVDPGNFTKWAGSNLVKVMRYYNLEADNFISKGGVQNFIIRTVKERYSTMKFQEYYCRFVYDGIFLLADYDPYLSDVAEQNFTTIPDGPIPQCRVVHPDSRSARIIGHINTTLEAHFGDFWRDRMLEDLGMINFVNIDDLVFLEGASTQATWPIMHEYDSDYESTTTSEPTDGYPGDDKVNPAELTHSNVKSEDYYDNDENNSCSFVSFFIGITCFIAFNLFFL